MKNLVVLTGAGMSAESGISTFRDAGGLWDKYPVEQVATPEGYQRDPALVINFYNERRKQLLEVRPNRGHELLAELEKNLRNWCSGKPPEQCGIYTLSIRSAHGVVNRSAQDEFQADLCRIYKNAA